MNHPFFNFILLAAVLCIPFWLASLGAWWLFLAIPLGVAMYGSLTLVVIHRMAKRLKEIKNRR